MSYFWRKAVLAFSLATAFIMPSCKKESSGDDPLPITYDPSVIIGSDNQYLYAFDPKTGEKHWELFLNIPILSSPVLLDTCVYVAGADGKLYKIDAKRGVLMKTIDEFPNGQFRSSPLVFENKLYVGSTNDTLYCIENDGIKWKFNAEADIIASPTVWGNSEIIFATTDGKMFNVAADNAFYHWTFDVGAGNSFTSAPVASGKFIFAGNSDNKMYAIVGDDGTLKWTFPTGYPIYSSPIIFGGSCVFGSDDSKLYCVDTATGLHRWLQPFTTGDRIRSSPFGKDNIIYVGSYDYNIYAISILNGEQKWKYKTYGLVKSSPLVYDGILYCGSHDKFVYGLDLVTGKPKWVQNLGGVIECSPMLDNLNGQSFNSSVTGMNQ